MLLPVYSAKMRDSQPPRRQLPSLGGHVNAQHSAHAHCYLAMQGEDFAHTTGVTVALYLGKTLDPM